MNDEKYAHKIHDEIVGRYLGECREDPPLLPHVLKIGFHQVKILYPHAFAERGDLAGQYDYNSKVIRICEVDMGGMKIHPSAIATTLLHEVIHAIDKNSGHRIFDNNEPALNGLSEGLLQVLADNKPLVEYLSKICDSTSPKEESHE